MFTGIIEAVGRVSALESRGGDLRLSIDCGALDLAATAIGDSIAVNGCCLTAVAVSGTTFSADVSRESLALTTLGTLERGSPVNLERALTLSKPLGGHLVTGHVDGIGRIESGTDDGRSVRVTCRAPDELAFFFFKQKTAYEILRSDWSSDVCSSDLAPAGGPRRRRPGGPGHPRPRA